VTGRGSESTPAEQPRAAVCVIELDRWGRVLLGRDAGLTGWRLPVGPVHPGEAPDAAAFRLFEEETGVLLEELKLFRVYRPAEQIVGATTATVHVYYFDADLDERVLAAEGREWDYVAPGGLGAALLVPPAGRILEEFFASTAYRAMFH
jgi:ADP-ribose pyrophosphatase YjhB (NUDIX family)